MCMLHVVVFSMLCSAGCVAVVCRGGRVVCSAGCVLLFHVRCLPPSVFCVVLCVFFCVLFSLCVQCVACSVLPVAVCLVCVPKGNIS